MSTFARAGPRKIRILLADDHPVIRKTVRSLLEQDSQFEIAGEALDGAKAIEEAQRLKPDVVILNVSMPVRNGIEAAREIKSSVPESAIVILSTHVDERLIDLAKEIGVRAFVSKQSAAKNLAKAIEAAIAGDAFVYVE
jgi:two-component system, NarL family, response regulator LiaR